MFLTSFDKYSAVFKPELFNELIKQILDIELAKEDDKPYTKEFKDSLRQFV